MQLQRRVCFSISADDWATKLIHHQCIDGAPSDALVSGNFWKASGLFLNTFLRIHKELWVDLLLRFAGSISAKPDASGSWQSASCQNQMPPNGPCPCLVRLRCSQTAKAFGLRCEGPPAEIASIHLCDATVYKVAVWGLGVWGLGFRV